MRATSEQMTASEKPAANMDLHRRMYERRLRLLRESDTLEEKDAADESNDQAPRGPKAGKRQSGHE